MRRRAPLFALFAADTISLVGNVVAVVAIPWFVFQTTGSAGLTGVTAAVTSVPVVIAAFFGGVAVDRLGYRRMSVVADVASAAAVAAIPAIHLTTGIELWQLLVLVFLGALLDTPGSTARRSILPDLAEGAGMELARATSIHQAIQRSSVLVGAPVGGVLVATLGATTALWVDAASFLVSAALVARFVPRPRPPEEAKPPGRYAAELAEGVRFLRDDRLMRAVLLTVMATNFLDAPFGVVMVVFADEAFGSAAYLGLMLGTFGGFAVVGSVLYGVAGFRLPRRPTFTLAFFVWALCYVALSTTPPLALTLGVLAVGGLAIGPINPLLGTLGYERVPAAMRGRVFGVTTAGAWVMIPLGALAGGFLVEHAGLEETLLAIGLAYVAVTGWGLVNPAFRAMDAARAEAASGGAGGGRSAQPSP